MGELSALFIDGFDRWCLEQAKTRESLHKLLNVLVAMGTNVGNQGVMLNALIETVARVEARLDDVADVIAMRGRSP